MRKSQESEIWTLTSGTLRAILVAMDALNADMQELKSRVSVLEQAMLNELIDKLKVEGL